MQSVELYLSGMSMVCVALSFMPVSKQYAEYSVALQMFAIGMAVLFHLTGIIIHAIYKSRC